MASTKSTGADGVRATTPRLGLLVLQPTPFCNINCSYCYLSDRTSTARMSLQILDLACRRVFESRLLGRELAFGISDPYQRFSGEAWSLLIALVLVGLLPNSPKWLMMIEEQLRGWVHTWFLVPDGVVKTIGILEDARYDPPANQLNAVASPLRERLQEDLRLPSNSF